MLWLKNVTYLWILLLGSWLPLYSLVISNQSHIPSKDLRVSIYETGPHQKEHFHIRNARFNKGDCFEYIFDTSRSPGILTISLLHPDQDKDSLKEIVTSFPVTRNEGLIVLTDHQAKPLPKLKITRRFTTDMCPHMSQRKEMRYGKLR